MTLLPSLLQPILSIAITQSKGQKCPSTSKKITKSKPWLENQDITMRSIPKGQNWRIKVIKPKYSYREKIPQVELKPFPPLLKYEFLGPNSTYPVIINANLSKIETKKFLRDLRLHRKAIRYTIDDIKGINPSICRHKILLENNCKPSIEPQRWLNPNMKEVVKKVLKLKIFRTMNVFLLIFRHY